MSAYNTVEALRARGREILDIILVRKDTQAMCSVLSKELICLHDDDEPLVGSETLIQRWLVVLKHVPDMTYDIREVIAQLNDDKPGGKVWAFSRVSGLPGGVKKDSVDMLQIDGHGRAVFMKDVQRVVEEPSSA